MYILNNKEMLFMADIKYKFNIENKSVEGYREGKMIFERVYNGETCVFNENEDILDTLVFGENDTVRQGIQKTDEFFVKNNIDQKIVVNLFRQNREYLPKRENNEKSNVIKIMRFHKKEA